MLHNIVNNDEFTHYHVSLSFTSTGSNDIDKLVRYKKIGFILKSEPIMNRFSL